ncbi:MAG: hypothetical protein WD011_05685 [Nitriliruptoraceae bacterium]
MVLGYRVALRRVEESAGSTAPDRRPVVTWLGAVLAGAPTGGFLTRRLYEVAERIEQGGLPP